MRKISGVFALSLFVWVGSGATEALAVPGYKQIAGSMCRVRCNESDSCAATGVANPTTGAIGKEVETMTYGGGLYTTPFNATGATANAFISCPLASEGDWDHEFADQVNIHTSGTNAASAFQLCTVNPSTGAFSCGPWKNPSSNLVQFNATEIRSATDMVKGWNSVTTANFPFIHGQLGGLNTGVRGIFTTQP